MTDKGQTIDDELAEIEKLRRYNEELSNTNKKLLHTVGDQGNQIGDLRKVIAEQMEASKESDWDFDPQEKEIRKLKQDLSQIKQAEALRELESKHPGFRELPKNQEFMDWIQESSFRANLYSRADNMDFGAADEMLTLWKERQRLAEDLQVQGNSKRRQALRDAAMEKGSAGGVKQTYFSRQELREMRKRPDEWAAKWPEIQKAYAEGRVK